MACGLQSCAPVRVHLKLLRWQQQHIQQQCTKGRQTANFQHRLRKVALPVHVGCVLEAVEVQRLLVCAARIAEEFLLPLQRVHLAEQQHTRRVLPPRFSSDWLYNGFAPGESRTRRRKYLRLLRYMHLLCSRPALLPCMHKEHAHNDLTTRCIERQPT